MLPPPENTDHVPPAGVADKALVVFSQIAVVVVVLFGAPAVLFTTTVLVTDIARLHVPLLTLVKFKVVLGETPNVVTVTVPPEPIVAVPETAPV
ncbi:hypothetical protein FLACHUCJ7_03468 [Flavobacterium chungangense]|uniref:Uncharacterized protein n=2 Tax=Flavobacterium TaxID=237 RepID=A0A6V6Z7Z0_9FLAO|nr:hypothetical protein FLAT13_01795 [Flavobacterium salmonis]CAD0007765.1 hypothetical protein FLACHUCJ7_03468 [Flavobacterium chungangense]